MTESGGGGGLELGWVKPCVRVESCGLNLVENAGHFPSISQPSGVCGQEPALREAVGEGCSCLSLTASTTLHSVMKTVKLLDNWNFSAPF